MNSFSATPAEITDEVVIRLAAADVEALKARAAGHGWGLDCELMVIIDAELARVRARGEL